MIISIASEFAEDNSTLLHKTFRAFEYLVEKLTEYSQLHDVVYLCLYEDLKSKIPYFDRLMIKQAHLLTGVDITEQGRRHDLLFLQ